jgi:hypothetical protein
VVQELTQEEYKEARREVRRTCRRKKQDFERVQLEKLEEFYGKNEVRKFYQEVKSNRKAFNPEKVCRDK